MTFKNRTAAEEGVTATFLFLLNIFIRVLKVNQIIAAKAFMSQSLLGQMHGLLQPGDNTYTYLEL